MKNLKIYDNQTTGILIHLLEDEKAQVLLFFYILRKIIKK